MFTDPNLIGKLAANPRTDKDLADPRWVETLKLCQQNPKLAESLLGSDPRMINVLGVLMGIDIQGYSRPEGSDDLPPGLQKDTPSSPPPQPTPAASSSKPEPTPAPAPEPEDVEMAEEDQEEAKQKTEAEAEKKLGAEAYKARNFEKAATHFSKAWDLYPKDITFLNNLGGK